MVSIYVDFMEVKDQQPKINTSFTWLSWEPNKMRVGKNKSIESTE